MIIDVTKICEKCFFREKQLFYNSLNIECEQCTLENGEMSMFVKETAEQEQARVLKEKSLFNKYGEE